MYVCVCHGVSERQMKQAIAEGRQTLGAIRQHFNYKKSCCGKCTACIRDLLNQDNPACQQCKN